VIRERRASIEPSFGDVDVGSIIENAPADVETLLAHVDAPPARVDAVERAVER
jgi:hypothetical protein